MKKNNRIIYWCQACGHQSPKWMGRCPDCGQWDSMVEQTAPSGPASAARKALADRPEPVLIDAVAMDGEERIRTGVDEFDRVLGGGIIAGSLVLIGGDPGIGKSTLVLQVLQHLAREKRRVLYVSGEESTRQLKMRSRRLAPQAPGMYVVSEIDVDAVIDMVHDQKPDALVIDSIQTMFSKDAASAPGSVTQVREATMKLMVMAKQTGIPAFLIGHVTKEGAIAGPRIMEHMVDTVLYFEGDQNHVFRILRAVKNRFGSTNEIGVFEMKESGLEQVPNPSAVFLSERAKNAPGSVVTACMEGTRPILVELQALISGSGYGTPRRTVLGLDYNRVSLLVAVMEKKLGLNVAGQDIFMNVAGGVRVSEPAVDLGIISAVASSFLDRPVADGTLLLGEVGLTGEVRGISHLPARIAEVEKMGFTRCIVPKNSLKQVKGAGGIELVGIRRLSEIMDILF
ncbi:DNA repair protein RadA/Sms [Desulfosalsimonas propionicica]|uniref:DNA repair protein RadA n=1 Tax=Desulfosalsimonas propionicica TaxID=332175 RepID=A0A7W0CBB5_9BACT|nr:DNA repair protein RadA [Desulfosalsimonas propionicica]MBA2882585.1 DNA repair protein RadA/Sms [Desulfosalsimonas propionicica]